MAERRMFAKSIIESDAFMDMPAEAQMLYIHLNMAADDDGFCDKPRQIMRQCGASNDTMKILIAKKFVLTFEKNDGFIIVIKHWRMNNYIRKDAYHETKYKEFMRELYFDENQSYSFNPADGHVPCVTGLSHTCDEPVTGLSQMWDESLTQDRLGKVRKGKDSIGEVSTEKDREGDPKGKPIHVLTDEQKAERIIHFADMLRAYMGRGWPESGVFKLAALEGITAEELRAATATAAEA